MPLAMPSPSSLAGFGIWAPALQSKDCEPRTQARTAVRARVFSGNLLSPCSLQGMGYLHAKGILHKDLKSKNVFYDNGKVVITDFGLFSISGVLQAGR